MVVASTPARCCGALTTIVVFRQLLMGTLASPSSAEYDDAAVATCLIPLVKNDLLRRYHLGGLRALTRAGLVPIS
jgi:hypothetical protein